MFSSELTDIHVYEIAVAEFCPAEAAVFCSERSVEIYTLTEIVKAEKEEWILESVQLLFFSPYIFSTTDVSHVVHTVTGQPSHPLLLSFFVSYFEHLIR